MNGHTKDEKSENFIEWVTFIDDRVEKWKRNITKKLANELNWKVDSLEKIERYILENFTKESIIKSESKGAVDAMASYIGETFRLNLPNAKWFIELDDEHNIYYNKPTIVTQVGSAISPFNLVLRILNDGTGKVLMKVYSGKSIPPESIAL
jgi:hypothetical protein